MNELLTKLCEQYNFTYDFIGEYIKIISRRDTWYILNKDHSSCSCITLYHSNNHGSANMHKQKGTYKTLYNIFDYIYCHDNKYILHKNRKLEGVI